MTIDHFPVLKSSGAFAIHWSSGGGPSYETSYWRSFIDGLSLSSYALTSRTGPTITNPRLTFYLGTFTRQRGDRSRSFRVNGSGRSYIHWSTRS